jgi:hyperosmotically inducible protein
MNTKLATTVLIVGSLLAPIAVHAADSDSDRAHPMTFVKDSAITAKVKANLAKENLASLATIRVDTDQHGKVFLSGTVHSQMEANKAVSIAQSTEGVASVTSSIKVGKDD